MILRDLDHFEIVAKVKEFEAVEGGRRGLLARLTSPGFLRGLGNLGSSFAFTSVSVNSIAIGDFTAIRSTINTITLQGDNTIGTPSISGISLSVQALASSQPFEIG